MAEQPDANSTHAMVIGIAVFRIFEIRAVVIVERYLPELKAPNPQDAVKIVSRILAVIDYKCDLRSHCLVAYIKFRNTNLLALKGTTCIGDCFSPEDRQADRDQHPNSK